MGEFFKSHWYFPGCVQKNKIAAFPEELPRRLIKMYSYVSEIVLDPFLGSGTSMIAANKLNRSSIGIDANKPYIKKVTIPNIIKNGVKEFKMIKE